MYINFQYKFIKKRLVIGARPCGRTIISNEIATECEPSKTSVLQDSNSNITKHTDRRTIDFKVDNVLNTSTSVMQKENQNVANGGGEEESHEVNIQLLNYSTANIAQSRDLYS